MCNIYLHCFAPTNNATVHYYIFEYIITFFMINFNCSAPSNSAAYINLIEVMACCDIAFKVHPTIYFVAVIITTTAKVS